MLTSRLIAAAPKVIKRNIGFAAPVWQKVHDPIQQLFLDKIRDFKAQAVAGKVQLSPELEKEKQAELDKIAQNCNAASSKEMSEFPKFNFNDPAVDTTVGAAK